MKTLQHLFLALLAITSLICMGCEETDIHLATQAGMDAVRSVTLDDADIERLAATIARQSDAQHTVAPADHPHARRLARLTAGYDHFNGHRFDFKVYLSPTVNAFAMADGTIRIYSGLMNMLDDRELLFVIGHEMGHVVAKHIRKKIKLAYAGSAVRKVFASQNNEAGEIARSALGALAEQLLNAQFSQQEEREADDYGLTVLLQAGYDQGPAVSALLKLASLGNRHSFLSSHPAPQARAQRLQQGPAARSPAPPESFAQRSIQWIKEHWPFDWPEFMR